MTPYLFCYAIIVAALLAGLIFNRLRLAAIVAFIPMFLLIMQRGLVGTDSAVYVQEFDVIRYRGLLASAFEPGFTLIVEILSWFMSDPFQILIFLGATTAIIMFAASMMLERSPLLFMTVILPYFMFDMSMNGLRYGLAFSVVALGTVGLMRGRLHLFIACAVIATSIQITAALLAFSLWALVEARIRTFAGVAIGIALAFYLFGDYIEGKVSDNEDIVGLGGLSGLAPLAISLIIIASLKSKGRDIVDKHLALLAIIVMQIIAFAISRYYYAGLRLQAVFLFLLYLYTVVMIDRSSIEASKAFFLRWSLVLAALLSSASRLKNFNDDVFGPSPFNPYYFADDLTGY
ncbi:EpsG family protein [Sphingopyxis sp.]|uniref:EpsG family protein n=1 Tax=Sphingopyxis sp. TaxID=1908224 RepID=UPI002590A67D|nr:EpsG family protein [Sphingopyxis sp.]